MMLFNICVAAFNGTNIRIYHRLDRTRPGCVCVGAKDRSYLELTYEGSSKYITGVKLSHTSGRISCQGFGHGSYWGCKSSDPKIGMFITRSSNQVMFPNIPRDKNGFYLIPPYNSMSPELIFQGASQYIQNGERIRVWYGEDLDTTPDEFDNKGETCFTIFLS